MTPTAEHESCAERLVQLLIALPVGEIRLRAAARELAELSDESCAGLLLVLVQRAAQREARVVEALAAVARAIAPDQLGEARRHAIHRAAIELGGGGVAAMFVELRAKHRFEEAVAAEDPQLSSLSLGHRRMLARRPDPQQLARLARLGEPQVIVNLLENPRMTEQHVIRIAAQRPIRARTLVEIAHSRRFGSSRAVRRTLVRNPYTPGELALGLLPLLLSSDWRELAADPTLAAPLRDEARELLRSRGGREATHAERIDLEAEAHAIEERRDAKRAALRREEEERAQAEAQEAEEELRALCQLLEGELTLVRVKGNA